MTGALQGEVFDEVAYCYDGTLEGLLSAIFAAYERHEDPRDVAPEAVLQPRLAQRVAHIETDPAHAERVRRGLCRTCGPSAFDAVRKASLSSDPAAGTAAYRFVRYAMRTGRAALSDITNPAVEPVFKIARAIDNECEKMRQFIRFEHLHDDHVDFWYARCNPRDSVVPLVLGHFVERFNVQPFIIYDENHLIAGIYDGRRRYLVRLDAPQPGAAADFPRTPEPELPPRCADEEQMQQAWKRFYRAVSIDARYNPELRRHFMPKRLWHNLTEMQEDLPAEKSNAGDNGKGLLSPAPTQIAEEPKKSPA